MGQTLASGHKRSGGMTLIELLITLSIVAILAGLAAPSFNSMIASNRASSATGNLVSVINLTRAEAIARGATVSVCGSTDPAGSSPSCDGSWEDGWVMYTGTLSAATVLKVGEANAHLSATGDALLLFNNRGRSVDASGTPTARVFTASVCDGTLGKVYTVNVNTVGRVSTSVNDCP